MRNKRNLKIQYYAVGNPNIYYITMWLQM